MAFWLVASHVPPRALGTQGLLFPSTKQTGEEGLLSVRGSDSGQGLRLALRIQCCAHPHCSPVSGRL